MEIREPTYFLLAGLLDGPRHGYAIAQLARELSGGRVGLSAGTLYGALERLGDQGLIQPVEEVGGGGGGGGGGGPGAAGVRAAGRGRGAAGGGGGAAAAGGRRGHGTPPRGPRD